MNLSDMCKCGHVLGYHSKLSTGCYGCDCDGYEKRFKAEDLNAACALVVQVNGEHVILSHRIIIAKGILEMIEKSLAEVDRLKAELNGTDEASKGRDSASG